MLSEKEVQTLVERHNTLENLKDPLVELVERFCNARQTSYNGQAAPPEGKLGNRQFQDLAGKANATKSVNEIKNFIRYQIARDGGWRQDNFGEELLAQLTKVAELARNDPELHIQLVRLYFGYLNRHIRYLRKIAKAGQGGER